MSENEHTPEELKELQSMDWQSKVLLTQARIIEFYGGYHPGMGYGNAYISFSGGKDSTVLLHIARQIYPDIPAVFSNTGLEYPEIQSFAKSHDNVEVVTPKMRFDEVISKYGYPLIGKEVAEAIYYARRLSRERERDRRPSAENERSPQSQNGADGGVPASRTVIHHRGELHGERERRGGTRQRSARSSAGNDSEAPG